MIVNDITISEQIIDNAIIRYRLINDTPSAILIIPNTDYELCYVDDNKSSVKISGNALLPIASKNMINKFFAKKVEVESDV
jgi:hypothetical protein